MDVACRRGTSTGTFLKRKWRTVFFRSWQVVGHASQVANPSDSFTTEPNGEPLLLCARNRPEAQRLLQRLPASRRSSARRLRCAPAFPAESLVAENHHSWLSSANFLEFTSSWL